MSILNLKVVFILVERYLNFYLCFYRKELSSHELYNFESFTVTTYLNVQLISNQSISPS